MFVIFGLGHKKKVEATGMFVCQKCSIKTVYNVFSAREYFNIFFIPIFPTGESKEPYVECQNCKRTYYTEILDNNNYNLDGTPFKKDDYDIEIQVDDDETHVIKNCPNCKTKIRLPKGKAGTITCPSCERKIYTSTK